jgi:hypothetical protein
MQPPNKRDIYSRIRDEGFPHISSTFAGLAAVTGSTALSNDNAYQIHWTAYTC